MGINNMEEYLEQKYIKGLSFDLIGDIPRVQKAYLARQFYLVKNLISRFKGEVSKFENMSDKDIFKHCYESHVLRFLKADPELLLIVDGQGTNNITTIAFDALDNDFFNVVKLCLENKYSSLVQDQYGQNIGMKVANKGNESLALLALEDYHASIQQDNDGNNIGMLCASNDLNKATLVSLDNITAAKQYNKRNESIASICLQHGFTEGVEKASNYIEVMSQKDNDGMSLLSNFNINSINKSQSFSDKEIMYKCNGMIADITMGIMNK